MKKISPAALFFVFHKDNFENEKFNIYEKISPAALFFVFYKDNLENEVYENSIFMKKISPAALIIFSLLHKSENTLLNIFCQFFIIFKL
jgi:hypothetical protein